MTPLLTYSIWVVFALISGILEGVYYSKVYRKQMKRFVNDHAAFTVLRGIIAVLLLWFTFGLVWQSLLGGVLLMMSFPFWHDGMYYQLRKWIDGVYPKGWIDNTTTSDAKFNFDFTKRFIMFSFSLFFLIL